MELTQAAKDKLVGIVSRMEADGVPADTIKGFVSEYHRRNAAPAKAMPAPARNLRQLDSASSQMAPPAKNLRQVESRRPTPAPYVPPKGTTDALGERLGKSSKIISTPAIQRTGGVGPAPSGAKPVDVSRVEATNPDRETAKKVPTDQLLEAWTDLGKARKLGFRSPTLSGTREMITDEINRRAMVAAGEGPVTNALIPFLNPMGGFDVASRGIQPEASTGEKALGMATILTAGAGGGIAGPAIGAGVKGLGKLFGKAVTALDPTGLKRAYVEARRSGVDPETISQYFGTLPPRERQFVESAMNSKMTMTPESVLSSTNTQKTGQAARPAFVPKSAQDYDPGQQLDLVGMGRKGKESVVKRPVFHGTSKQFDEFADVAETGGAYTAASTARLGHFFSEDPTASAVFATGHTAVEALARGMRGDPARIIRARIDLQNPLDFSRLSKSQVRELDGVFPGFAKQFYDSGDDKFNAFSWLAKQDAETPAFEPENFNTWANKRGVSDEREIKRMWDARSDEFKAWEAEQDAAYAQVRPAAKSARVRAKLQSMGYDGIIVNTAEDSANGGSGKTRQFVVFDPKQITNEGDVPFETALAGKKASQRTPLNSNKGVVSESVKPNPDPAPVAAKPAQAEAPKPEANVPQGINRADRAAQADALGTNKPVKIGGKSLKELEDEAKTAIDNGLDVESIIDDVAKQGRAAKPEEFAAAQVLRTRLLDELQTYNRKLEGSLSLKERESVSDLKDALLNRIGEFDRRIDEAKGAAARSLGSLRIGQTVNWRDVDEVLLEAKRRRGGDLAPKEVMRLEKQVAQSEKDIALRDAKIKELEDEATQNVFRQPRSKNVASVRRDRAAAIDRIRTSRTEAFKAAAKAGNQNMGLQSLAEYLKVVPEIAKDILIVAKTLIDELQIKTFDELMPILRKELPDFDITDDDIRKVFAGTFREPGTPRTKTAADEITAESRRIVSEAEAAEVAKGAARNKALQQRLDTLERELKDMDRAEAKSVRESKRKEIAEAKRRIAAENKVQADWDAAFKKESERLDRERRRNYRQEAVPLLRRADKIASQNAQLRTGITIAPTKRAAALTKEIEDLDLRIRLNEKRIRSMVNARETTARAKLIREGTGTLRVLKLGADFGAVLRQGLFGLASPRAYGRSLKNALSSIKSDEQLLKVEEALRFKRINGKLIEPVRVRAALSRSDTLSDPEEAFIAQWFKRIPGLGKLSGVLERGQTAFLNTLRTEMFDSFAARHPDATDKELAAWANYINSATGRSALFGAKRNVPDFLSIVMTSPRYEASRWEMAGNYLGSPGTAIKAIKGDKAARAKLFNMGVTAGTVVSALKIAESAGAEIDWDPTSSDFLKARFGNNVIDPTAGISPRIRTTIRLALMSMNGGDFMANPQRELGKSVDRSLSPGVKLPFEIKTGKTFSGFDVDEDEKGWKQVMPLILAGFLTNVQNERPERTAGYTGAEFFGLGVSRYPKRTKGQEKP